VNVRLNVILVGAETYTAEQRQQINTTIAELRKIYLGIGLHFSIDRFKLTGPLVRGRHKSPITESDVVAISRLANTPDATVDLYIVRIMPPQLLGQSPTGGPCSKRAKGRRGVVAGFFIPDPPRGTPPINDMEAFRAIVWAHELGHYFGLEHCPCDDLPCLDNVMRGGECIPRAGTHFLPAQVADIKRHCAVSP
jgi:hypothetical protein